MKASRSQIRIDSSDQNAAKIWQGMRERTCNIEYIYYIPNSWNGYVSKWGALYSPKNSHSGTKKGHLILRHNEIDIYYIMNHIQYWKRHSFPVFLPLLFGHLNCGTPRAHFEMLVNPDDNLLTTCCPQKSSEWSISPLIDPILDQHAHTNLKKNNQPQGTC